MSFEYATAVSKHDTVRAARLRSKEYKLSLTREG
jgi:hypothetical protein